MENKTKKEIDSLYAQIAPLQQRINELDERETLSVQRPRLNGMVGYCLRSTYEPKSYYGKILDLVEDKNGWPHFILEVVHITKEGNPYMHLDNVSPYLNKEWWDAEIPVSGWERCPNLEYETFKGKVAQELQTQKSLRSWVKKLKY